MRESRALIVGGGLSGLAAGAFLSRAGLRPLILERSPDCGGLVQSFTREGFTFDAGPRALLDSGILRPLLEELGIELPLVRGLVSAGIGGEIVSFDGEEGVDSYLDSLKRLFPGSGAELSALRPLIRSACVMSRTLRRLPNPLFKNPLSDPQYLFTRFLPWLSSFLGVALRTGFDKRSIESVLSRSLSDPSLRDMLSQHFFKGTPWHFALGYLENFRDYLYPLGGTGELPRALEALIRREGGEIETDRAALSLRPASRTLVDSRGEVHAYGELLWAADLRSLYASLDGSGLPVGARRAIERERSAFSSGRPGESAFTLFLAVDESPEFFARVSRGHFIYTPRAEGLGDLARERLSRLKAEFDRISAEELYDWVGKLCEFSSYEISIPALQDPSLAPEGATGLTVSILFDGELWELARRRGLDRGLREKTAEGMLKALDESAYPGLRSKLRFMATATPLSLEERFSTAGGAITGWSLEGKPPVPSSLAAVLSSVRTAIPHVWRAGQWSYSPSGVPVALLTGRIASGAMLRRFKRRGEPLAS